MSGASIGHRAIRRVYRAFAGIPNRLLHGKRYHIALRRLSALGQPRHILVVCPGNVCRSPYLAAVLQRALPEVKVSSAGLVASGRRVPSHSLALSAERGIDLSNFRSRPLVAATVRDVDLVLVMDIELANYVLSHFRIARSRVLVVGDFDPTPGRSREIEDPWKQRIEVFASAFDRLDRCAATIVAVIKRAHLVTR
jgi:protein-tyrosine phosphatase